MFNQSQDLPENAISSISETIENDSSQELKPLVYTEADILKKIEEADKLIKSIKADIGKKIEKANYFIKSYEDEKSKLQEKLRNFSNVDKSSEIQAGFGGSPLMILIVLGLSAFAFSKRR